MARSSSTSARRRRGSSLVEVMVASVILILGLTGVMYLLTRSQQNNRQASNRFEGSAVGLGVLDQYSMAGYDQLTVGTFGSDGGYVTDKSGAIVGTQTVEVIELTDAGYPAREVRVTIEWQDWGAGNQLIQGTTRRQVYATVVSAPFDGGY